MNTSTIIAISAVILLVYTFGSDSLKSRERQEKAKEYHEKMTPLFEQASVIGERDWKFKCIDLARAAQNVMNRRQEDFDLDLILDGLQSSKYLPSENNIILGYVAQAYATPIVSKEKRPQVVADFASKKQNECMAKLNPIHNLIKVDDPNKLERIKKQDMLEADAKYFLAYSEEGNKQTEFKVIAKIDIGKKGMPINWRTLNQEIVLAIEGSNYVRTRHGRGNYEYKVPVAAVVVNQKERNVMIRVFIETPSSKAVGYELVNTVELIQDSNGALDLKK